MFLNFRYYYRMKRHFWIHRIKFFLLTIFAFLYIVWPHSTLSQEYNSTLPTPSEKMILAELPSWARMVDIRSINRNIRLDMRYATTNNFLNKKVYPVAKCALRAEVAENLSKVQQELETMGLGLKVYDCYRPLSVQRQMWAIMPDSRYVANPAKGSRHNRGSAVDVTLVDRYGKELEMPSEFDDFSERAYRDYQGSSAEAQRHIKLLEEVMQKHGFTSIITEWWHFDAVGWQKFSILDISFRVIP